MNFKRIAVPAFLGLILSLTIWSCQKETISKNNVSNSKQNSSVLKSEISESTESDVNRLIEIRDYFNNKVIEGNVNLDSLKSAYLSNDEDRIMELLDITQEEVDEIEAELNTLRSSIINKNPSFFTGYTDYCTDCHTQSNINKFFNNYSSLTSVDTIEARNPNWPAYVACLVVCTTSGPFIYWPCAYLCYDSYAS